MTKEKAIKELDSLTDADSEAAHAQAEDVLIDFLNTIGHKEVGEAFNRAVMRCGFWYA